MKAPRTRLAAAIGAVVVLTLGAGAIAAQGLQYPATRKVDHSDTYHGTEVPDPYRWLEDDTSAETTAWVEAQNKVTFPYLERIPWRNQMLARVRALNNYEKFSAPSRKGPYFFFSRNEGLQKQSVLFIQKGLEGAPEVLIDPNTWSEDGTVRLTAFVPSKDAKYAAFGVSKSGSDWQEYKVIELATKKALSDSIEWVKVSGIAWHGDGFFYSRYPIPAAGHEKASINENHQVYFHRVGTPQAADVLVFEDRANPQRFHTVDTTDDQRFAVLTVSDRGKGKDGNAVFVRDLAKGGRTFTPVIPAIGDDTFEVIDNVGGALLVQTNRQAPNGRVIRVDPRQPAEANWKTVLPERPEPLQRASTAGGKLFATYLKDVTTRAYVYSLAGRLEHEVALPGPGVAGGFGGERDTPFVFYTFNSLNVPPTIYRYDIASRTSTVFRQPKVPEYDVSGFETKQVFYNSKDGTRVPMFLVHRKGLKLDGTNPTLLYAYGGFNIVTSPTFSAARLALLEQGFVYASANIRGGGEYGESWHKGGMKLNKQNVFDDFIAAAEWLIANKYTSPARLAIQGGSNGGLLVGAVMNQRPELFRVAIPQVGVMDMLRFHKFTIGWNWIADYGSSEDSDEFGALYAYSPLHNIKAGTKYPATLITTADHDDRVVPAHSFKYAATLQERASRDAPVLIRIETKSGHGASSLEKQLETAADIYTFIMHNMGLQPASVAGSPGSGAFSSTGLHYTAAGQGADVVLIHAFQMDLREWDAVVPALVGSRRVIRYDVRGHGTSKVAGDLPSQVLDLLGLLDELQVRRATLVGLSMGSTIALDFALTYPGRVERLVLASPGIPGVSGGTQPAWLTPIFGAVKGGDAKRAAELWWDSPLFDRVRDNTGGRQIVTENSKIWTFARRPPAVDPPAGTRLKDVSVPVVTVAGDADPLGGHDIARAVAAGVPKGRVVLLNGAGHMLTLERPADLAKVILEQ